MSSGSDITWTNTEWISQWQLDPREPATVNDKSTKLFILKIAFNFFFFKVLAILFRYHYKIILDMDGALDGEQSAFNPIKLTVDANQSLLITYL